MQLRFGHIIPLRHTGNQHSAASHYQVPRGNTVDRPQRSHIAAKKARQRFYRGGPSHPPCSPGGQRASVSQQRLFKPGGLVRSERRKGYLVVHVPSLRSYVMANG